MKTETVQETLPEKERTPRAPAEGTQDGRSNEVF